MIHELDPDWLLVHTGREKLPELRLIAAIIEDAIQLIQGKPCKSLGRERLEALAWVQSDSSAVFSFRFCCVALNLDADATRRAVLGRHAKSWDLGEKLESTGSVDRPSDRL
jgi:hypothetical protein